LKYALRVNTTAYFKQPLPPEGGKKGNKIGIFNLSSTSYKYKNIDIPPKSPFGKGGLVAPARLPLLITTRKGEAK
jgi:hypothetical protein